MEEANVVKQVEVTLSIVPTDPTKLQESERSFGVFLV